MQQPIGYGSCSYQSKQECNLLVTDDIKTKFLEELSVFYVAVTRASKQIYFTASENKLIVGGILTLEILVVLSSCKVSTPYRR